MGFAGGLNIANFVHLTSFSCLEKSFCFLAGYLYGK